MKKSIILPSTVLAIFFATLLVLFANPFHAESSISKDNQSNVTQGFRNYEFFDSLSSTTIPYQVGTTSSATSSDVVYTDTSGRIDNGYLLTRDAKAVTVYFSRSSEVGANSGSSIFRIQVSDDGVNWYDYNKLVSNVTNTNAQTLTRVNSVTLTGTSTSINTLEAGDAFFAIRCIVQEVTDGTHRCRASARY